MKASTLLITLLHALLFVFIFSSCHDAASANKTTASIEDNAAKKEQNEVNFITTLEKHLNAVSERDLVTLKSTLSPTGKMRMMLPGSEIFDSVDSFMEYHTPWLSDTTSIWTFDTKILHSEISENLGTAITQIVYSEPERNGEPYFNRMYVSYVLEKTDGKWYVIQDHCSSTEKSTD